MNNFSLKNLFFFLSTVLSIYSCTSDKPSLPIDKEIESTQKTLSLKLDKVKLRDAPNSAAKTISVMGIGNTLIDLEEVSKKLMIARIDSTIYCEPWLKVKTIEGLIGWIYAAGFDFSNKTDLLIKKRAIALLGEDLYENCIAYRKKYETSQTDEGIAKTYHEALYLRDSILTVLDLFLEELPPEVDLPDLFWMEQIIPGFIPQLVAEGSRYYFFADYKQWLKQSKNSSGKADDDFIQICLMAFSSDSVEYFFPAWTLQTWDYGGHSLLGRGIHLDMLSSLDSCYQKDSLFHFDLLQFKQQILDDITIDHITYWESKEKILQEIDAIIKANIPFLSKEDKIALEVRRGQFEEAKKYNIQLNLFSGSY